MTPPATLPAARSDIYLSPEQETVLECNTIAIEEAVVRIAREHAGDPVGLQNAVAARLNQMLEGVNPRLWQPLRKLAQSRLALAGQHFDG